MNIVLTGATSKVGVLILHNLLNAGHSVYCLTRSEENRTAENCVFDAIIKMVKAKSSKVDLRNLNVVDGDITKETCDLSSKDFLEIFNAKIDVVMHTAIKTDPRCRRDEIQRINVDGTANVIKLAKLINCQRYYAVFAKSIEEGTSEAYRDSITQAEVMAIESGLYYLCHSMLYKDSDLPGIISTICDSLTT